ncbi:36156_t:CDS:2, partial [Racocetra persica]
ITTLVSSGKTTLIGTQTFNSASKVSNLPSNLKQSFQESTTNQYQEIELPIETISSDEGNDDGEETSDVLNYVLNNVLPLGPIVKNLTGQTSHAETTTSNNRNKFESYNLIQKPPLNISHNPSNEFEVALWLARQPRILNLAITQQKIHQEEYKALFLRTKNNMTTLYEELIMHVYKISKSDD